MGEYKIEYIRVVISSVKRLFVFLLSICLILPGVSYHVYSLNNSASGNEKIIGKLAREIEIPAGSDYYIRFFSEDFILAGESIAPYSSGLSEKIKDAIAKSPRWIQKELTRQFHMIDGEAYADLILDTSRRYVDEIAFSIACSSLGDVPSVDVIKDNVFSLYETDKWIQYADIMDYDDNSGNYYSTIRYRVMENGTEKQLEYSPGIYYWFVVHPEAVGEQPLYIYNKFWRDYLFNHNDIGYPLLKEKLSDINYLWDCTSYFQFKHRTWKWSMESHPTAVEAVSYWVGKTVPEQAYGDRPGQPNTIAHEHNGWCGELQKIAVAALRSALIPTVGICDHGEDHVWREFFERGWHENDNWWADGGGAVDKPDVYAYQWGKDMSALFAWMGDDSIYDVTSRYIHPEDRKTVHFVVLDRLLQPVDGARVSIFVGGPRDITWLKNKIWDKIEELWDRLPDVFKGRILLTLYNKLKERIEQIPDVIDGVIPCIWNYTNMNGECTFELGKNCEYLFIIQQGNLRKPWQLAKHNTLRILSEPKDTTFRIVFPSLSPQRQKQHDVSMPGGDFFFDVSFSTSFYQIHESILWIDDKGVYNKDGMVEFFVVDKTNFEKYRNGRQFNCHKYSKIWEGDIGFNADECDWYFVFRNKARSSNVILNFSVEVETSIRVESVQIISPDTSIFNHPVFNSGDTIMIKGVATDDILLYIDDEVQNVETYDGEWCYKWDTFGKQPGEYVVTAMCGDAQDSLSIKLIDVRPPLIEIDHPSNNEIVEEDVVIITGHSWDNLDIERIEVSIDRSEWRMADGTNTWSIDWNISGYGLGNHIISARAYDKLGSVSIDEIYISVNESGHEWKPQINSLYHQPENSINTSNVIVYVNVTEGSPFLIQKVVLYWNNGTVIKMGNMYRYGDNPVQERHEEDPLKNESNNPIFGLELGQFATGTNITYWIIAYDTANNSKISSKKSLTIENI